MRIQAERDGLLADVLANPGEDWPRLVYADWCEDNGEEDVAVFIRYGVGHPSSEYACESDSDVGLYCGDDYGLCQTCHDVGRRGMPAAFLGEGMRRDGMYTVRRGFVAEVRCALANWLDHGAAIVKAHPLELVVLTDKVPSRAHASSRVPFTARGWYRIESCDASDELPNVLWNRLPGITPDHDQRR